MKHSGFSLSFLHPRSWLLWCGLGLLWLITQLPYKVLLWLGRVLGA
ncbi:MAG: lipid A biosynthesis lauroyl acyltransferase, partial [Pseudomonas sp.]